MATTYAPMTPSVTACVWFTSRPRRARAREERWMASGAATMAARRRREGAMAMVPGSRAAEFRRGV